MGYNDGPKDEHTVDPEGVKQFRFKNWWSKKRKANEDYDQDENDDAPLKAKKTKRTSTVKARNKIKKDLDDDEDRDWTIEDEYRNDDEEIVEEKK